MSLDKLGVSSEGLSDDYEHNELYESLMQARDVLGEEKFRKLIELYNMPDSELRQLKPETLAPIFLQKSIDSS